MKYIFMHIPAIALLAAMSSAASAKGVEIEAGKQYPENTRVQYSALGVSFVIPNGWLGGLSPDGSAFILGSKTKPGMIIARADNETSLDSLKSELSKPMPLDGETVLQPKGTALLKGDTLSAELGGTGGGGPLVGLARARKLTNGTLIGFVAIGPEAERAGYGKVLTQLLRTLRAMTKAELDAGGGVWASKLRGQALVYMKTGGGMSTKKVLSLCADGRFTSSFDESYMSGDFSAAGQDGNRGRWTIAGSSLKLSYDSGGSRSFALSNDGTKTLLDGQRWFVTTDDLRCP